ncbi:MAG: hypothetical protein DRQ55_01590 [Planctomycetota bacterium]|nr:MAG: hypothetical protein DRQ55_01590 [Planctomycetota bacterium]
MSGPRILVVVMLGLIALIWVGLSDDPSHDRERGLQESQLALEAIENELRDMESDYRLLSSGKLRLDLKVEHDEVRSRLALLRSRRLRLADDTQLERRQILPAFRSLVVEADEALAFAQGLGRRVKARHDFIVDSSPLLRDARALRDALQAHPNADPVLRGRVDEAAGWFAELEGHALRSDSLLQQNPQQGAIMAGATLNGLRRFLKEGEALRDELDAGA